MTTPRLLLVLLSIACLTPAEASIRVYDVDPAYRQEIFDILTDMLDRQNPDLQGNVQLLPTGQLSVDTLTDERQEQIASLLAAIERSRPTPTPSVTLRYWVLAGGAAAANGRPVPEVLADVVRELETTYGELDLRVLDVATVTGRGGADAFYESDQLEIMQTASSNDQQLNARIFVEHELQELNVDVSLTRGEYLVLSSGTSSEGMIAVVVNWP